MTTNVTVLGASGSTVTIPFTSASNANAAQAALGLISDAVRSTFLNQYLYPGSGTVPAPSLIGGVVISGSEAVNTGPLPSNVWSVVSNSTATIPTVTGGSTPVAVTLPGTTVTGTFNPMTVASGTAGIMFLNVSERASIYLGGGNNFIFERADSATATINVDAGATYVEAMQGSTTINAFGGAGVVVQEGGTGTTVINAVEGSSSFLVDGGGAGSPIVTVNGAAGASFTYYGVDGASAIINPNSSDVTISGSYGGDTSGTTTLFGGTGTAHVYGGTGLFYGGTGGANELGSSTLASSTTLVGAHDGDVLYNAGKGNLLIAGAGSETLVGIQDPTAAGGSYFQLTGLNATVFGDASGGNSFYLGAGLSVIDGDGSATTHSAANFYSVLQGGGTSVVFDFISGLDQFSTTYSAGAPTVSSLTYYEAGSSTIFGAHAGTELILSDSTKVDFYDVQVKSTDIT